MSEYNPVIERLQARGIDRAKERLYDLEHISPKWFRNDEGLLKKYHRWKEDSEKGR